MDRHATTVLVVDDEPSVRDVIAEYLCGHGYSVKTAATGVDAIAIARGVPLDAVLLDLTLHGSMEGRETLAALRERAAGTPVIVLSGSSDEAIGDEMLALGAFDYVRKPLLFPRLADVLDAALTSCRAVAERQRLSGAT